MDIAKIREHWYGYIYDQFETYTEDIDRLTALMGPPPLRVLEPCCGTGRILSALAHAGYAVDGFDLHEGMRARIDDKVRDLTNVRHWQANALTDDWGGGYDVVILAGNIMINIETARDYAAGQRTLLAKAAAALQPGGHVFVDMDIITDEDDRRRFYGEVHPQGKEGLFKGTDDHGTFGRYVSLGGIYDPVTRIGAGLGRMEITLPDGTVAILPEPGHKYFPTLADMLAWISAAGLAVARAYGDKQPDMPVADGTYRATFWLRKP